jgi:cell wall-associated NlpC family hydrolase
MNRHTLRLSHILPLLLTAILFSNCNFLRDLTTDAPKGDTPAKESTKEASLRRDIASYAQKYKGTRYRDAGKTPSTGFDCSGFTSYVMRQFSIQLSPSSREQATQGRSKPLKDARPGDLVFFRRSASQPIFHVAMVVSNDNNGLRVIHSTTSRGVVVDDLLQSPYWKPKIDQVRDVVSSAR